MPVDSPKKEHLQACLQEVAQILYDESDLKAIQDLEDIEKTVLRAKPNVDINNQQPLITVTAFILERSHLSSSFVER